MNRLLHRRVVYDIRGLLEDGEGAPPALAADAFIHLVMEAASRAADLPVGEWSVWSSLQPAFPHVYPPGLKEAALELLNEIPRQDWRLDPQLPGWLYQYWLIPQKDQLFRRFKSGAKASHGDIPAVTQLFTPDWIARYLAENTLGRLWSHHYPETGLHRRWSYYDHSAEPAAASSVPGPPEDWTVLDPACGCGHLLAAAFDVWMDMYREAGAEPGQAARAILNRHLYGLDIDPAAVRICRFVLLLKAAAVAPAIAHEAVEWGIAALTRETGVRFGSLDRIEQEAAASETAGLPGQTDPSVLLSRQYHAVITNPPYLGRRNMDKELGDFLDQNYPRASADLFAAFLERCLDFLRPYGYFGAITPQSWMFLSGFEELRTGILTCETIISLLHLGARAFEDNNGQVVQTASFILCKTAPGPKTVGSFWKLTEGASGQKQQAYKRVHSADPAPYRVPQAMFSHIPGMRLAYELPDEWAQLFRKFPTLDRFYAVKKGMDTGCNERYVRLWHEVPPENLSFRSPEPSQAHWFPYAKGGGPQKWYGNHYYVVFWQNNGEAIRRDSRSNLRNFSYFGRPGITWSTVSTGRPGFRLLERGFLFDNGGSCLFPEEGKEETLPALLAYLNSAFAAVLLSQMNPTLNIQPGDVARLPADEALLLHPRLQELGEACLRLAKAEWDETERSWDYAGHPAAHSCREETVEASLRHYLELRRRRGAEMKRLEETIDRLIHSHYGLKPLSGGLAGEQEARKQPSLKEAAESLLAYAAGCLFGTYSCGTGNTDGASSSLIRDKDWVPGLKAWLARLWSPGDADRNLETIARFLGIRLKETAEERIFRYFAKEWYPGHCREFGGKPRYLRICSGSRQALLAFAPVLRLDEGIMEEVLVLCDRRREELLQSLQDAYIIRPSLGEQYPEADQQNRAELPLDIAELEDFTRRLRTFAEMNNPSEGGFRHRERDARALMERYRPVFDC